MLHLVNMRRNDILSNAFAKAGMTAIPDISWYDQKDIGRWIEWLINNNVHTVAITLQCLGNDKFLRELLISDLLRLVRAVKRKLHLVFIGGDGMILQLFANFRNFSVFSLQPFIKACGGRRIHFNGYRFLDEACPRGRKEDLFWQNLKTYNELINELSGKPVI